MTTLIVPNDDGKGWPTLGEPIIEWMEANLTHGPGDLKGEPYRLDDEKIALTLRAYEVYPKDHPQAGRRRFKRVHWSLRKGSAKTEHAAAISACELHPECPVRTVGWKRTRGKSGAWVPIGEGITDPYIPMAAYTEDQTEELAYGCLCVMLSEGPLRDEFDVGLERIVHRSGDGKAEAVAAAPDSADGARTTFQHFDETHRFVLQRHHNMKTTMLNNVPKRIAADAWSLETTTSYAPGEDSDAERTMEYAEKVADGRISDADTRLFFFHRQASDKHDLSTPKGRRAAILEASGPVAEWSDIESILSLWQDPRADVAYLERVWTNRPTRPSNAWLPGGSWEPLKKRASKSGEVVLAFDGSHTRDAAGIVVCTLSGRLSIWEEWERPANDPRWVVSRAAVDASLARAFEELEVRELAVNPDQWRSETEAWAVLYGSRVVVEFPVNSPLRFSQACSRFYAAVVEKTLSHDGNTALQRHLYNAVKRPHRDGEYITAGDGEKPIALARAAVIAYERAAWHASRPKPGVFVAYR